MIEGPIKVGDRIEVEGVFGTVREIRARSTTVVTNDNVSIIVPFSQFIASQMTNVSHSGNLVRYRMPVGGHYNSDVHVVTKALEEICAQLLGVVPRETVAQETAEEQADMFLQASGIGDGEEIRSTPLMERCVKRLAWLGPNIGLNMVAANEASLREVIALAVLERLQGV